jgi:hypothetical protein
VAFVPPPVPDVVAAVDSAVVAAVEPAVVAAVVLAVVAAVVPPVDAAGALAIVVAVESLSSLPHAATVAPRIETAANAVNRFDRKVLPFMRRDRLAAHILDMVFT